MPSETEDLAVHNSTPITINVYDLLPVESKLSSVFWFLGVSLLHTGVAINDREYAFGGHQQEGVTGVYWMKPKKAPPGSTYRQSILHAHSPHSPAELEEVLREAAHEFLGTTYNVLTRNCNHFTGYLVEKLTGKAPPKWINRAASIGVALPCVVPQAWIEPPTFEEEEEVMLPPRGSVGSATTTTKTVTVTSRSSSSSATATLQEDVWTVDGSEDEDEDAKAMPTKNHNQRSKMIPR